MATFPALKPARRRVKLGIYPVSIESGFGGGSVRFLHGVLPTGQTIELEFTNLVESKIELIREHYRTQQGAFYAFALPEEVTAGAAYFDKAIPVTTQWKYSDVIAETHKLGDVYDVVVMLEAVR